MRAADSLSFGSMLKQYRVSASLSQEELAARTGLSPHGISDLERGARRAPRPRTVRLLADGLGLSADERAAFLRAASTGTNGPSGLRHTEADERGSTAAPAKSSPPITHNLPFQPTALLGREHEIDQVTCLLQREDIRLVTITGPGGVGKTRLSTHVAFELVGDFPNGVWMVPLARLTDPGMVMSAIAQAVGASERGTAMTLNESVCAHLRSWRTLLLLDNFEHVLAAATEVATVLTKCPELKVLVTSRAPLHLRGEHEYSVSPLTAPNLDQLPPAEHLRQYASVALFVERARAARTDFQLTIANAPAVAAICARLDGLPLAIELAAARVKLLDPHALLAQLAEADRRHTLLGAGPRDLDERQQTLRGALAWSYALLTVEERRLFRRLSIFLGGWTLAAAEATCAAPPDTQSLGEDVLDGISRLLDHSLICRQASQAGDLDRDKTREAEPRFTMLHVIREYGVSLLEASDEVGEATAVRAAHAAYFAERARMAGRVALALSGHSEPHWSAWLKRERDNLVGALAWLTDAGDMSQALWVAATLVDADIVAHLYTGARRRLDHLLDVVSARAEVDPEARLLAISRAAILAAAQEDLPRTEELSHERVALARAFGIPRYTADAISSLAYVMLERGASEEAVPYAEEAVALARQAESPATIAYALENLALIHVTCGDLDQAQTLADEGLQLSRRAGFLWGQGINAGVLALVRCSRHDPMGALRIMRQGVAALRDHGWLHAITGALQVAACAWAVAGDGERSARLLGAAGGVMARAKGVPEPALARLAVRMTAPVRAALGEERWERSVAAGGQLSLDEAITEAFAGVDQDEPSSGS